MVTDPEPGGVPWAWRTYRECLRLLGDGPGIIVQDDVVLAEDFESLTATAVADCPCRVLCLFVSRQLKLGGSMMMQAAIRGESFARLHSQDHFVPMVAVAWPPGAAKLVLEWASHTRIRPGMADDGVIAGALKDLGLEAWATVPSLVEHPDDVPSLVNQAGGRSRRALLPHPSLNGVPAAMVGQRVRRYRVSS